MGEGKRTRKGNESQCNNNKEEGRKQTKGQGREQAKGQGSGKIDENGHALCVDLKMKGDAKECNTGLLSFFVKLLAHGKRWRVRVSVEDQK